MIAFRHADPRFPFLWESRNQPPARWHAAGEGPMQYLADTPDGAWAEFLRHEEITDPADLIGVRRDIWAVELPASLELVAPRVSVATATGGLDTYPACQAAARNVRKRRPNADGLRVAAAALLAHEARGYRVQAGGLVAGPSRTARTLALFGLQPRLIGWRTASDAHPAADLLVRVRHL